MSSDWLFLLDSEWSIPPGSNIIYAKLQMNNYYGKIITEYLTNYMCFIVLSVEIFSILFTFGVVKSVVVLLFVNTAVFMGLLVVGLTKMDLRGKEIL